MEERKSDIKNSAFDAQSCTTQDSRKNSQLFLLGNLIFLRQCSKLYQSGIGAENELKKRLERDYITEV